VLNSIQLEPSTLQRLGSLTGATEDTNYDALINKLLDIATATKTTQEAKK
jgi:hypothetical protein